MDDLTEKCSPRRAEVERGVPGEIVQAVVEHADEHDLWGVLA